MLQPPAHSLGADFVRLLQRTIGPGKVQVVGADASDLAGEFAAFGLELVSSQSGDALTADTAVWIYPKLETEDVARVLEIARIARSIVLLPGSGADPSKRRPQLVSAFWRWGFTPDYAADLRELDSSAIRLVRNSAPDPDGLVLAAEAAIARQNQRLKTTERSLRTRMSELESADRHIAKLEEKLLALKEAKRALKQLKEEKQALRKSPERKIGQVLLAPYRLPQKLLREVRKRRQQTALEEPRYSVASATEYQAWFERHRAKTQELEAMRAEARTFQHAPLISIITPVYNTPPAWLAEAINSVLAQIYENWELILIDDASTDASTVDALATQAARDPRIRVTRMAQNGGISSASNHGLTIATGEWVALLDHDDLLEPDALFQMAKLLQTSGDADLIYSDEDKLTEEGFDAPLFKPDWSPDFFLSYNYICHFVTMRRSLVDQAGGFRPRFDGAQDYDLLLRVTEQTDRIHHIPRVLYHWRRSATSTADNIRRKPGALDAGKNAIGEHLQRRGIAGHVAVDWRTHAYWVKRDIADARTVSIIIPTRDQIPLLARCIESLIQQTSYADYEIVIVDNDSTSDEARDYFAQTKHRVLRFPGLFNFSAINNFAVGRTHSPWLLFLNNDVEVIEADWLSAMVEHVQRPEVGAVGGRLLYPDDTVQHAGVVIGVGGVAQDTFRGFPAEHPGVARQLQVIRNYSAVTGACLLTRREVFDEIGGFDEERLPVNFNDIDLCLKMRRAGYLVVYTPYAKLRHHESASRKLSAEPRETEIMRERWADVLAHDPYYNPNLSRERADFSLGN